MKHGPHICYHSAKSYVGKFVNVHMKDGTVLINVQLEGIENKDLLVRGNKLRAQSRHVALFNVIQITDVPIGAQMLKEGSQ